MPPPFPLPPHPPSQPRPLPYIHHLRGIRLTKRGTHVESPMFPTLPPFHPLCTRRPLPRGWGAAAAAAFSCACLAVDLSPPPPRSRVPREWKNWKNPWTTVRAGTGRGGKGGGGSKAAGISVEKRTRACNLYLPVDGGGHATMLWSPVSKQDSMCPLVFPDAVELMSTNVGDGKNGRDQLSSNVGIFRRWDPS